MAERSTQQMFQLALSTKCGCICHAGGGSPCGARSCCASWCSGYIAGLRAPTPPSARTAETNAAPTQGAIMDSRGHVHMFEEAPQPDRPGALRHTGFVTKDPMPEQCDARKVLSALDKIADRTDPVAQSDAALVPLTPFEKGYVLGVLAEYRAWRAKP